MKRRSQNGTRRVVRSKRPSPVQQNDGSSSASAISVASSSSISSNSSISSSPASSMDIADPVSEYASLAWTDVPMDPVTRMPLVLLTHGCMLQMGVINGGALYYVHLRIQEAEDPEVSVAHERHIYVADFLDFSGFDSLGGFDATYNMRPRGTQRTAIPNVTFVIGSVCCGLPFRNAVDCDVGDVKFCSLSPDLYYEHWNTENYPLRMHIPPTSRPPHALESLTTYLPRECIIDTLRGILRQAMNPDYTNSAGLFSMRGSCLTMSPITLRVDTGMPKANIEQCFLRELRTGNWLYVLELIVNAERRPEAFRVVYLTPERRWVPVVVPVHFANDIPITFLNPAPLREMMNGKVSPLYEICVTRDTRFRIYVTKLNPPHKCAHELSYKMRRNDDIMKSVRERNNMIQLPILPRSLLLSIQVHGSIPSTHMVRSKTYSDGTRMNFWTHMVYGCVGQYSYADALSVLDLENALNANKDTPDGFLDTMQKVLSTNVADIVQRNWNSFDASHNKRTFARTPQTHSIINKSYSVEGSNVNCEQEVGFPRVLTMNSLVDDDGRVLIPAATDLTTYPEFVDFVRAKNRQPLSTVWQGCNKLNRFETKHFVQFFQQPAYAVRNLFLIDRSCSKLAAEIDDPAIAVALTHRAKLEPTRFTSHYMSKTSSEDDEHWLGLWREYASERREAADSIAQLPASRSVSAGGGRRAHCRSTRRRRRRRSRRWM